MSIFTHIVVGTNDIEKAGLFYDKVFATLGINHITFGDSNEPVTSHMYGKEAPAIIVTLPLNGEPATYANGGTIGLVADSNAAVDAFHAAALANGGSCEGEPGPRENAGPNTYGAYIRDIDGNKLCAYCFG